MNWYFVQKQWLKRLHNGFVSYKHSLSLDKTLIVGLELYGLLVDYCDISISSHFVGTHNLQNHYKLHHHKD